jgi:hypothetical protein
MIERISARDWVVHSAGNEERAIPAGYLTAHGGFSTDIRKARRIDGCGRAIRIAQVFGIGITEGVRP